MKKRRHGFSIGNAAALPGRFALLVLLALLTGVVVATSLAFADDQLPAPQKVEASRIGDPNSAAFGDIVVRWAAVKGAYAYEVRVSDDGGRSWNVAASKVMGSSATISDGISSWLPYHVSVRAMMKGVWSGALLVQPYCPVGYACAAGSAPTTIEQNQPSDSTTVAPPAESVPTGNGTQTTTSSDTSRAAPTSTPTSTTPGGSGVSNHFAQTYALPPAAPTTVVLTTLPSGQIKVSWSSVVGATGYNVVYSIDGEDTWTQATTNLAVENGLLPSYVIKGIDSRGTIVAGVQAVKGRETGPWTNSAPHSPAFFIGKLQLIWNQVAGEAVFSFQCGGGAGWSWIRCGGWNSGAVLR